jgi:hypothetical protein
MKKFVHAVVILLCLNLGSFKPTDWNQEVVLRAFSSKAVSAQNRINNTRSRIRNNAREIREPELWWDRRRKVCRKCLKHSAKDDSDTCSTCEDLHE